MMGVWIEAARPKTLVAGAVPILVGTAAAGRLIPWRFVVALVAALAVQVGANFANDYFDAVKGVDLPTRIGPRRLTASGLIPRNRMKAAIAIAFLVASFAGLALAVALGPAIVAVAGLACVAAGLAYSGGPRPYGSAGWGEAAVFIFFGAVGTVGAAYVQTGGLVGVAVAASVPIGLLATSLLVANNVRDIATDRMTGKATLAVRIGRDRSRVLYRALVVGAFVSIPMVAVVSGRPWPLLALLAAPLALRPWRLVATREDAIGLVQALVATARLELFFGVLLAAGLWIP